MPLNEDEFHPYLQIGESIPANKMIVGTFPIYSITRPGRVLKAKQRQQRNDILFFYGSNANWFWSWYHQYIDQTIDIENSKSILESLRNNQIAISDVIKNCRRINCSFEDKDLKKKTWNTMLSLAIENNIDRVICTSKADSGAMGWLRDKILLRAGFTIDEAQSNQLHMQILNAIPQSRIQIKPIARVLTKMKKHVSILALPSPGSPQRQLAQFGYNKSVHNTTDYLNNYLTQAFNWFK